MDGMPAVVTRTDSRPLPPLSPPSLFSPSPQYCTFAQDPAALGLAQAFQPGLSDLVVRPDILNDATLANTAAPGSANGAAPLLRAAYQFDERRVEQYMDNVLAFEYVVQGSDAYSQDATEARLNAAQPHLSARLDVRGDAALDLNGSLIARACPGVSYVATLNLSSGAAVVMGVHDFKAGEVLLLTGVKGAAAHQGEGWVGRRPYFFRCIGRWGRRPSMKRRIHTAPLCVRACLGVPALRAPWEESARSGRLDAPPSLPTPSPPAPSPQALSTSPPGSWRAR